MFKNENKKQIVINQTDDINKLNGKIIDKCSLVNGQYNDEKQLIITFDDDTYICIGLDRNDNSDTYDLVNDYIVPPKSYACGVPHYFDYKGKLRFKQFIQRQIDLKLITVTEDEIAKILSEKQKAEEEREYQLYLKLKEKYDKQ